MYSSSTTNVTRWISLVKDEQPQHVSSCGYSSPQLIGRNDCLPSSRWNRLNSGRSDPWHFWWTLLLGSLVWTGLDFHIVHNTGQSSCRFHPLKVLMFFRIMPSVALTPTSSRRNWPRRHWTYRSPSSAFFKHSCCLSTSLQREWTLTSCTSTV